MTTTTDTTTTTDPDGYETAEWTCIGKRLLKGDKLGYAWLTETGDEVYYDKLKGHVGGVYAVTFRRSAETTSVKTNCEYVRQSDDERRSEWAAEDRADSTRRELALVEKNAARANAIGEAVEPLRALYRKQVGHARRAAFLAAVIEELTA